MKTSATRLRLPMAIMAMVSCLMLAACSTFDIINGFVSDDGSIVQRTIPYGTHPRQRLDIYRPTEPDARAAVIVFFYGGGWERGAREDYEFVARKIAAQGHYVVVPDYRLFPEVVFPSFVQDGARATAYVLDQLTSISGTPRPVFLMGHSAGAHIAMLIAVDTRYLGAYGRDPKHLAGVVGLAGPYDFLPLTSPRLLEIFPDQDARYQSQPVRFAGAGTPPVLLAHGDTDETVWPRNSINMTEMLRNSGARVCLRIYPGMNHLGIIKPFLPLHKDKHGVIQDILAFLSAWQTDSHMLTNSRAFGPATAARDTTRQSWSARSTLSTE